MCPVPAVCRREAEVELSVTLGGASLAVPIVDPYRLDAVAAAVRITAFCAAHGSDAASLDIAGLVSRMVKGVAGCEAGCPADAKGFVSRGFAGFSLEYVEGGILTASARTADGRMLHLKLFPDF